MFNNYNIFTLFRSLILIHEWLQQNNFLVPSTYYREEMKLTLQDVKVRCNLIQR